MSLIFALLGWIMGGNIAFWGDVPVLACLVLSSFLLGFLAYKNKAGRIYFAALGISLGLFLLYRYSPRLPDEIDGLTCIVIKASENYVIVLTKGGKYYVNAYGHGYERFDVLRISGSCKELIKANYESQFDFQDYLEHQGIKGEIIAKSSNLLWQCPLRIRQFSASALSRFSSSTREVLMPLLFNRRSSSSFYQFGSEIGASYVLSASGLFYMGILRAAKKVARPFLQEKGIGWLVIAIGTLLLPLYGGKAGVIRAYSLLWISQILLLKKIELEYLPKLSLSAFAVLLLRPFSFCDSGFLLGLGICLLLYYSRPLLERIGKKKRKYASLLLLRLVILPVSVSGGSYAVFGLFYTLLLTPFSWVAIVLGASSILFRIPSPMMDGYCSFYLGMVRLLSNRSIRIGLPFDGSYIYFIYYGALVICLFLTEIGFQRLRNIFVLGISSLYAASLIPFGYLFTAQVSFINVGQGDSILIRHRDKVVMIDTGGIQGIDMAGDTLLPFLHKQRIYHIDALIATHAHYDHMGAAKDLMKSFNVKRYVDSKDDFPLKIGGIELINYNVYESDDINETSLFIGTKILGYSFLFTGDAGQVTERKIIKDNPSLDCDILKVGHHGSETSSCIEFLKAVTPEVAVISVGRSNSHGHPKDAVLGRLRAVGAKIRRTDLEGTITYRGLA